MIYNNIDDLINDFDYIIIKKVVRIFNMKWNLFVFNWLYKFGRKMFLNINLKVLK